MLVLRGNFLFCGGHQFLLSLCFVNSVNAWTHLNSIFTGVDPESLYLMNSSSLHLALFYCLLSVPSQRNLHNYIGQLGFDLSLDWHKQPANKVSKLYAKGYLFF